MLCSFFYFQINFKSLVKRCIWYIKKNREELSSTYNPIKSLLEFMSLMRGTEVVFIWVSKKKYFFERMVLYLNEIGTEKKCWRPPIVYRMGCSVFYGCTRVKIYCILELYLYNTGKTGEIALVFQNINLAPNTNGLVTSFVYPFNFRDKILVGMLETKGTSEV